MSRCGRQDRMAMAPHLPNPPQEDPTSHRERAVVLGTIALVALAMIGTALVACARPAPTAPQPTAVTTSESQKPTPPFETSDGFAWITAACGSPSVVDASPNSWLPGASNVALCITPPGRAPVLVGVYDDPSVSAADVTKMQGQHGYATRQDGDGRTWIFVVEGVDPAPLTPLERYGFVLP
jgi:hypothetical protein